MDGAPPGADASEPLPPPLVFPAAPFEPSDPGWLHIAPESAVLRPGETVALRQSLHTLDGTAPPAEVLAWTSSAPDVATVDAAGLVTAVATGLAEIVAEDSGRRRRTVSVTVSDDAPAGPVSIAFSQPLVQLTEGAESTDVEWTLLDARGVAIGADVLPSFEVVGGGAARGIALVAGPGTLHIEAPLGAGVARVIATLGAEEPPLAGTLVVSAARSPLIGPCGADDEDEVECWLEAPPDTFTTPGLSDTLRVVAAERSCGEIAPRIRQVAPDDITLADDEVITVGAAGTLVAVAPGFASFGVRYRGRLCDCPVTRVLPDANGCWTGRCGSGDEGVLSLSGWRAKVIHAPLPGRVALRFQVERAVGRSRWMNGMAPRFECDEAASWEPSIALYGSRHAYCEVGGAPLGERIWVPESWLCSERGCESWDPTFCAASRNTPEGSSLGFRTTLRGSDRFDLLACTFERTGAGACDLPVAPVPPTGSASFEGGSMEVTQITRMGDAIGVRFESAADVVPSLELSIAYNGYPMLGAYRIVGNPVEAMITDLAAGAHLTQIISFPDDIEIYNTACDTMTMLGTAEIIEASTDIRMPVAGRFDLQVYPFSLDMCGGDTARHLTGSFRGTPSGL